MPDVLDPGPWPDRLGQNFRGTQGVRSAAAGHLGKGRQMRARHCANVANQPLDPAPCRRAGRQKDGESADYGETSGSS